MTVDLVIAGRRIRLCSREGVIIRPDERFTAFTVPSEVQHNVYIEAVSGVLSDIDPVFPDAVIPSVPEEIVPELVVDVEPGPGEIPASAVKVFDAQLMEEVPGGVVNSGEPFWEVFSGEGITCARVFLRDPERTALLMMPHGEMRWKIFTGEEPGVSEGAKIPADFHFDKSDSPFDNSRSAHLTGPPGDNTGLNQPASESTAATPPALNPLPYPLDGLLLYFLFSREGDIMIHGSGVSSHGRGWLFSGRSGSGKTTMARIFDHAGDRVIHDDRLVLRLEGSRWVMHNTPVYRNDEPRSVPLDHIWLIRHGSSNVSEPVAGAEAVAMILANCIQQNWDREAAARLAASADDLAASVKVSRLSFLPDGSIRDYLRLRKEEGISLAAEAVAALLEEGKNITVTAGGYSMWPTIRPGDIVVIGPWSSGAAAAGQIVALRRDGGFVLHRITGVIMADSRNLIRTRGDAAARADEAAGPETVAGMVISLTRRGRQLLPPRRRTPYWLNRIWAMLDGIIP